ncbi:hypothetical protein CDAR_24711 [Caerostris darwini]|uniref:Uncharacterized protein n=1 Tax=Caerostris darwini TaxID=1538125 RepID=A0AAV4PAR1_9ARAC|nr:hypothetical protein CDAR_24711 [Caerostris darwini]
MVHSVVGQMGATSWFNYRCAVMFRSVIRIGSMEQARMGKLGPGVPLKSENISNHKQFKISLSTFINVTYIEVLASQPHLISDDINKNLSSEEYQNGNHEDEYFGILESFIDIERPE